MVRSLRARHARTHGSSLHARVGWFGSAHLRFFTVGFTHLYTTVLYRLLLLRATYTLRFAVARHLFAVVTGLVPAPFRFGSFYAHTYWLLHYLVPSTVAVRARSRTAPLYHRFVTCALWRYLSHCTLPSHPPTHTYPADSPPPAAHTTIYWILLPPPVHTFSVRTLPLHSLPVPVLCTHTVHPILVSTLYVRITAAPFTTTRTPPPRYCTAAHLHAHLFFGTLSPHTPHITTVTFRYVCSSTLIPVVG